MSYIALARRKAVAAEDETGLNDGNWTNVFDHATLKANVARFECHRITAIDVPAVATIHVFVGNDIYSAALLAGDAEWDPVQPMLLSPEDDVYLCWDVAASGTPPTCWMWLRYDPAIQPAMT